MLYRTVVLYFVWYLSDSRIQGFKYNGESRSIINYWMYSTRSLLFWLLSPKSFRLTFVSGGEPRPRGCPPPEATRPGRPGLPIPRKNRTAPGPPRRRRRRALHCEGKYSVIQYNYNSTVGRVQVLYKHFIGLLVILLELYSTHTLFWGSL